MDSNDDLAQIVILNLFFIESCENVEELGQFWIEMDKG
jgi:hypothetical protein